MAQLVILGHKTRSKEVIEILEMLGGRNLREYVCNVPGYAYSIGEQGIIDLYISPSDSSITFTLEEFLEKYPYKVGDKVLLSGVVKIIKQVCWSDTENEVIYKLETNVRGFSEEYHVHHYDLQPYKEETKEKLNVAKLLKDCPQGMELDSPVWDNIIFEELDGDNIVIVRKTLGSKVYLTQHGEVNSIDGKCIIFPKGKTTWEGFVQPCKFKDGDVVATKLGSIFIFKESPLTDIYSCYVALNYDLKFICKEQWFGHKNMCRFATEEEKEKLFKAIKDNGYKWNPETKELEKLIQPKFKIGDKVLWNYDTRKTNTISQVTLTENRGYVYWIDTEGCSSGWWGENELTPIPDKFDISTLIPFESRVLARYCKDSKWIPTFWGSYDKEDPENPYNCCGMLFAQCIPFEGNEHLLNKTDDCVDYFKTWE